MAIEAGRRCSTRRRRQPRSVPPSISVWLISERPDRSAHPCPFTNRSLALADVASKTEDRGHFAVAGHVAAVPWLFGRCDCHPAARFSPGP